jgi:hypothetical protein
MKTLFLALILLAACAIPPLPTPSGRPEVTFPLQLSLSEVRNILVQHFATRGFDVRRSDEHSLLFTRIDDSLGARLAFGTPRGGNPELRINATTVQTTNGVRVILGPSYVSNPGTAFEKSQDVSNWNDGKRLQAEIEQLIRSLHPQAP